MKTNEWNLLNRFLIENDQDSFEKKGKGESGKKRKRKKEGSSLKKSINVFVNQVSSP